MPEAVFQALTRDEYSKGSADYSVTEILNPPQIVQLKRRYWDKLEEDVMDNCWSIFGKAAHHILEGHAPEDSLSEERLYVDILGRKLGGQVDNYHDGTISDYKITSAYTLVYGSRIKEWEEQLNAYAYIFRQNGYTVDKLQIITILRDWNKTKALQDFKYPQTPIVVLPITLWSEVEQHRTLEYTVGAQIANELLPDNDLWPCLSEDCWEQETKYAVMTPKRKTAFRVVDSEEEANRIKEGLSDATIVKRPGRRTRCEDGYCPVASFCSQYKQYKEESNS